MTIHESDLDIDFVITSYITGKLIEQGEPADSSEEGAAFRDLITTDREDNSGNLAKYMVVKCKN
jgi:hypothetical protein